jgi:hypothetical protein
MNPFKTPLIIGLLIDIPFLLATLGITSWLIAGFAHNINQVKGINQEQQTSSTTSTVSYNLYSSYTLPDYTLVTDKFTRSETFTLFSNGSPYETTSATYTAAYYTGESIIEKRSAAFATYSVASATTPTINAPTSEITSAPIPTITALPPTFQMQQRAADATEPSLIRRDSIYDQYLHQQETLVALASIILVAVIIRLFTNIITIILIAKNKHRQSQLRSISKTFVIVESISTAILLIFTLSFIVYAAIIFGHPFGLGGMFDFFWIFTSVTGIVLVFLAILFLNTSANRQDEERDIHGGSLTNTAGHGGYNASNDGEKSRQISGKQSLLPSLQQYDPTPQSMQRINAAENPQQTISPPQSQPTKPSRKALLPSLQDHNPAPQVSSSSTPPDSHRDLPAIPNQHTCLVKEEANSEVHNTMKLDPPSLAMHSQETSTTASQQPSQASPEPQLFQAIPDGKGGFIMKPYTPAS